MVLLCYTALLFLTYSSDKAKITVSTNYDTCVTELGQVFDHLVHGGGATTRLFSFPWSSASLAYTNSIQFQQKVVGTILQFEGCV